MAEKDPYLHQHQQNFQIFRLLRQLRPRRAAGPAGGAGLRVSESRVTVRLSQSLTRESCTDLPVQCQSWSRAAAAGGTVTSRPGGGRGPAAAVAATVTVTVTGRVTGRFG